MSFNKNTVVFRELKQRKGRLFSGLLAITLGISVIVAIQSITEASRQVVARKLDLLGANIQILPQGASVDDYYSADIDAPTFPEEYVDRITASTLPGIDNLSPKLTRKLKIGENAVVLTGILPRNELAAKPVWQTSGLMGAGPALTCVPSKGNESTLTEEDRKAQRKAIDALGESEAWAGSLVAQKMGLRQGSTLDIQGTSFTVTHVLPETGTVDDNRIFAHLRSVQKLLGVGAQVSNIEIMGCCNEISEGLLGKLRNILPDTRITTIGHIVNAQIETNRLMSKVAVVLLFLIVLVGSVSIGNYVWANVEERRKEIGTLIAIGWDRKGIYRLFLQKSILLGLAGGLLGYLLGTLAAIILGPYLAGLAIEPVFSYLGWSLFIAVLIAFLGSCYPVYRAARLDPAVIMQEI
jgi:putative ABC transport system permease protein